MKKTLKERVFSDEDQLSTLKGCFSILIVQFFLLILTISFSFIIYIGSGITQSFAIAGLLTNIGYHVVVIISPLDDVGEYAALRGIAIWYVISILALTIFIELLT